MATEYPKKYVETKVGKAAYLELGVGYPVIFIHGIPTSSYLWRNVMEYFKSSYRAIAMDLMGLGDTEVSIDNDYTMPAQADYIKDVMDALGIVKAVLVAHDQGGAAAQIFALRYPERLTHLVLTDCVAYDNWPVPVIKRLMNFARRPLLSNVLTALHFLDFHEKYTPFSAFKNGVYDRSKMTNGTITEYLRPLHESRDKRERFRRFLLAGDERFTMEAAEKFDNLNVPTMILWAENDRYISKRWGKRLYEEIEGATRFHIIPQCGHFWQEEKPEEFSRYILEFIPS